LKKKKKKKKKKKISRKDMGKPCNGDRKREE
jgi:hypothetical protein